METSSTEKSHLDQETKKNQHSGMPHTLSKKQETKIPDSYIKGNQLMKLDQSDKTSQRKQTHKRINQ